MAHCSFVRACLTAAVAVAAMQGIAAEAVAQSYPARPVTLVVPFTAGGNLDAFGRVIAEGLSARLNQQVVVENRGGSGGLAGTAYVARARPDGYTIIVAAATQLAALPAIKRNPGYDPVKDFAPISYAVRNPPIWLLANPANVSFTTLPEMIAYARANPGKLKIGSDGLGTTTHVPIEQLKRDAGIDVVHVPFTGTGQMVPALLGGHVDMAFVLLPAPLEHVKSGKLRPIASASAVRRAPDKNLPTIAEQGFPGFDYVSWYGIAAPAGTPPAIVDRLSREIAAIVNDPQVQQRLAPAGFEFVGGGPKELAELIKSDFQVWSKLTRDFNLESD